MVALAFPGAALAQQRDALIVFHPGGGPPAAGQTRPPTVFERLSARPQLALGLMSATQGAYTRRQTLLDLSAGNRVSRSGYEPRDPPRFAPRRDARGWWIAGWDEVVARARGAPVEIVPGLLAGAVPGGAAYVGDRHPVLEAAVAAGRDGRVGAVSLGAPQSLPRRVERALAARRLAVAVLPPGPPGDRVLDALLRARPPGRLLLVIRRPPRSDVTQMLPFGTAGLAGGGVLTSRTTRRDGLVSATDVAPTVLRWLGLPEPDAVRGRAITATGERDPAALRRLERRLRVVYPRRFPAVLATAIALAVVGLALSLAFGRAGRRRALRVCALAVLWLPTLALVTAALSPARADELAIVAIGSVVAALVTDRLAGWPRAPAVPALLGVGAYTVDLALGSDLIVRSLLGPNPRFGSRYFGIGNELEAILPPLLLIGLAAALSRAPRGRRTATIFAVATLALGLVVGAGRLGADVGGVVTIGAAGAAAVLALLPGGVSRRALAFALLVPVAALAALAAIDLVTGGDAHFTSTVLGADDTGDVLDTVGRRYELAWNALRRGLMPLAALAAVALAVAAVRRRRTLYAPVADRPAWSAALVGGLAASVAGALANDSGPVLLVIGVVVLAAATAYVRGDPRLARATVNEESTARVGPSV